MIVEAARVVETTSKRRGAGCRPATLAFDRRLSAGRAGRPAGVALLGFLGLAATVSIPALGDRLPV